MQRVIVRAARIGVLTILTACGGNKSSSPDTPAGPSPTASRPHETDVTAARERLRIALDHQRGSVELHEAIYDIVELGDRGAVPLLLAEIERPGSRDLLLEVSVAAAVLGGPEVATALLEIWAQDVPAKATSRSMSAHSWIVLASMGSRATREAIAMLHVRGRWASFAETKGIDPDQIAHRAAKVLGTLGDPAAVQPLLSIAAQCPAPDPTPGYATEHKCGAVFEALGFLGDRAAVPGLCARVEAMTGRNGEIELYDALGRLGGPAAAHCLLPAIGASVSGAVEHALWDAIVAADADGFDALSQARDMGRRSAPVLFEEAMELARVCKNEPDCFRDALTAPASKWQARALAAHRLVRLTPDDPGLPLSIAHAFRREYTKALADAGAEDSGSSGPPGSWRPSPTLHRDDALEGLAVQVFHATQGRTCPVCAQVMQVALDVEPHHFEYWQDRVADTVRIAIARVGLPGHNFERSLLPVPRPRPRPAPGDRKEEPTKR